MRIGVREWVLGGLGVLIAAATLYNTSITARLESRFTEGYHQGVEQGKLDLLEKQEAATAQEVQAHIEGHREQDQHIDQLWLDHFKQANHIEAMYEYLIMHGMKPLPVRGPHPEPPGNLYADEWPPVSP